MTAEKHAPTSRRRRWWLLAAIPAALLAIAVIAFVVWGLTPLQPTASALAALESGNGVTVTEVDGGWAFVPSAEATAPAVGMVFYPGGHVDARAYATYARAVAEKGFAVAIAKMPLSLAVLNPNAAESLIGAPELDGVETWTIAGHSLGGVMAARYAAAHPDQIRGLVLLASYPDSGGDLSGSAVVVADVTGSVDGVLNWENWEAAKPLLPGNTAFTRIEGGNHAQFGDYGAQPGDNEAEISAEDQREQTTAATVAALSRVAGGR